MGGDTGGLWEEVSNVLARTLKPGNVDAIVVLAWTLKPGKREH